MRFSSLCCNLNSSVEKNCQTMRSSNVGELFSASAAAAAVQLLKHCFLFLFLCLHQFSMRGNNMYI